MGGRRTVPMRYGHRVRCEQTAACRSAHKTSQVSEAGPQLSKAGSGQEGRGEASEEINCEAAA